MKTTLVNASGNAVPEQRHGPSASRLLTGALVRHGLLVAASFLMLYPLLWMVASSFKPESMIFTDLSIIPPSFDFSNYTEGWMALQQSFTVFFKNSFLVAVLVVIGNVLSCSITAYAFARLEFRGRRIWFVVMLGTLMLPYHVTLIPQYVLFLKLGWIDTFLPLIVPKFLAADAFFIFLMVQFFRGIPRELDEAAVLDGCSPWRIYWKIMMPLVHAGADDYGHLFLHLDLERLLRAAGLPERRVELHGTPGIAFLSGFHRSVGMGPVVCNVRAGHPADLSFLSLLSASHH